MKYQKKLLHDNCLDYKPHNLICMFFSSYVFMHSFIDSLFVPPTTRCDASDEEVK